MGIEPYLVATAIDCVVAQRLARRLCPNCRRSQSVPATDAGLSADGEVEVFEPGGCGRCRDTGYQGRIGLFEVMRFSDEIRSLIIARAPVADLARVAVAEGMRSLVDDGLAKVRAGETTLAEVARVTC
jgi:type IV pilus assembly protein PilB